MPLPKWGEQAVKGFNKAARLLQKQRNNIMKFTIGGISVSNEKVTSAAPEPKIFGLRQAEAALRFVSDPAQVKGVLAVVVGVLGFKNTVAADVAAARSTAQERAAASQQDVVATRDRIAAMERYIADLENQIAGANARDTRLGEIAGLFADQPAS